MKHDIERVDAEVKAFYRPDRDQRDNDAQLDLDDFSLVHVKFLGSGIVTLQVSPVADRVIFKLVGIASFTPLRHWLVTDLRVEGPEYRPPAVFDLGMLRGAGENRLVMDVPGGPVFSWFFPLIVELSPWGTLDGVPIDVVLVCDRHAVPTESSSPLGDSGSVP